LRQNKHHHIGGTGDQLSLWKMGKFGCQNSKTAKPIDTKFD